MRFAVTLIVWISDTPLDSLDAAVVGVLSALTSAAYPFTDNPINAKPTSIDIRCLICCLIPNASLNTYIFTQLYKLHICIITHLFGPHKTHTPTATAFSGDCIINTY